MAATRCIYALSRRPDNTTRLVCFPHAGAGASIYCAWDRLVPHDVGVHAVQLAGREQRADEQLRIDWVPLVEEICDALARWHDQPFAFYGHSLGGLIAYEVANALRRRGATGPRMLFVGASYAPSAVRKAGTHFEDDESLLQIVRRFGGVDDTFAAEPEFVRHFLPVIAADFTLFNRYVYDAARDRLDCPVIALYGTHDADHDGASMARWKLHTRGSFHAHAVHGGHFFHRESAREAIEHIVSHLGSRSQLRTSEVVDEFYGTVRSEVGTGK
ncbi:alpha/beta fold hydrolase [Burkholderia sola]|uniref:thioesterase II family protein n=1 Tax=Burkholderia TaxID=32008 RepID=UPI001AE5F066|nr:alpha/beta fold hydrolase [Burkholderia sp. AcTa6-5]MBP0713532.1 thioesterase [Burkholderia sp. AcTa6-5]